ncbi:MAG: malonyl-ACP O-methyltransferase BioC [Burkholderiales bacterium]
MNLNRSRLRRSFDRAAFDFESVAALPREVAIRMHDRLSLMRLPVQRILDAGCGTGHGARMLRKRYGGALVVELDLSEEMLSQPRPRPRLAWSWLGRSLRRCTVCADLRHLPLAESSIDLIWSNLALHWVDDLEGTLAQMLRVLRPGGLLMFSILGPDTLKELRAASSGELFQVNPHVDMHDIGDMLIGCGYAEPVMDMDLMTLTYADLPALLRDLRAHGSISRVAPSSRGLGERRRYQRVASRYAEFERADGRLPATFEVIFGHAWRPQPRISPKGERVIELRSQTK